MAKTAKDITMDIMKDNSRVVDYTQLIDQQYQNIRNIKRQAGSKPSKTETAYILEQEEKLAQYEDIVKRWIWTAWEDDEDVFDKTMHWSTVEKNYKITVLVEKI